MVINIFDLSGQQVVLPIVHFADILSRLEIWNLQKRYYDPIKDHYQKEYIEPFAGVVIKPKMTQVYKVLHTLKEVNEDFEYMLWLSSPDDEDERGYGVTFSKQGQTVLIDIH